MCGVKALLVEPPKKPWEMMGDFIAPPIGLAQLAAVLEADHVEVDIVDCNAYRLSWEDLDRVIAERKPTLVGASAMTTFMPTAARVMQMAKRIDESITTVVGGPHVTFTAEETLHNHPEIDIVGRGEGERVIVDLVRCLDGGGDLGQARGIAFRRGGEIVQNPLPEPVDLDRLPMPAYHLLPMQAYYFIVFEKFCTVLASRGCPFHCVFCAERGFWGPGWRPRDPKIVGEELELLHRRYGRESIWFGDDCFNVDGEHMGQICEEILRRDLKLNWYYQGRADLLIKHQEYLPLMRRAGNLMVQIGIEADSDEELRGLRKNLTGEQVKEAIALLRKNGIVCQGMMILGTRQDDANSILRKVEYLKWLDVDFPVFTIYTPFPGTEAYDEAREKGWLETDDYALYDMAYPIISTEHLSRKQIIGLYNRSFASFYTDPLMMLRGLFSSMRWKREIWRYMLGFAAKLYLRRYVRVVRDLFRW
jgi:anaerobic magnesium-protoporphyrin IX monomethyl ester cyclase